MMGPMLPISVIVPVYNGAADLPALLTSFRAQTEVELQILILDSGSTDGTSVLAAQFPETEWYHLKAKDFSHSATRNLGVTMARHDLVLCTVQDARFEKGTLASLASILTQYDLAALSAAETPRHDADAFARYSLHTYYHSLGLEIPRTLVHSQWEGSARQKIDAASIGNVACLYRRNLLSLHPFEGVFAEDFDWAVRALKRGERVGKTSEARVIHSHTRSAFYGLRRGFASRRLMRRFDVAEPLAPRTPEQALALLGVLERYAQAEGADLKSDADLTRFMDSLRPWHADAPHALELASVLEECAAFDDGDRPTWVLKALAGRLGWLLGDVDWTVWSDGMDNRGRIVEALANGL